MRMLSPTELLDEFVLFTFRRDIRVRDRLGSYRVLRFPWEKQRGRKKAVSADGPRPQETRVGPRPTISPSSLRGQKHPVKSGISGRRKVFRRYLTWFYDRCLYGYSFLSSLPHSHSLLFSLCPVEGTLPLIASLSFYRPLLSFSRSPLSYIAQGGICSEDRRGGGLEKDSVAHPPTSFGRFKLYFDDISSFRGVDGSGRSWILRRLKIIHERHLRRLNMLMPPHKLICCTKTPLKALSYIAIEILAI